MAKKRNAEAPAETPVNGHVEPTPDQGQQEKRRPVQTFKCASGKDTWIEVAVWTNEVTYQDGGKGTQLSTTFSRSYKHNEEWRTNYSYRQHDLPVLLYLMQQAYAWILDQRV